MGGHGETAFELRQDLRRLVHVDQSGELFAKLLDVPIVADLPIDQLLIDVGSETVAAYEAVIAAATTLFVNGPAGVYESAAGEYGTRSLWEAVAASDGYSVIGGGDTVASARRFVDDDNIGFISTAGGALIRFISGQPLPLLDAMEKAAERGRML